MRGRAAARVLAPALVLTALVAGGCDDWPGRPETPSSDATVRFDALYGEWCAGCHGAAGRLGPARPLADPVYLGLVGDDVLRRVTSEGVPGSLMPGFGRKAGGSLDADQVEILVRGIRRRWGGEPTGDRKSWPAYAVRDAPPGDPARGRQGYTRHCRGCHGEGGRGGPKGGSVVDPDYLSLVSDQALRSAVLAGRPDLGMPDWRGEPPSPLGAGEIADVVAWLASQRPSPAAASPARVGSHDESRRAPGPRTGGEADVH